MLTLFGPGRRYCDGVSRRSFLKVGGLAMGGLALPELLRAEAAAGSAGSHKSVIMVYLVRRPGAPGHLRPQARRSRRGPRRVQADRDQGAGHPDRRAPAEARGHHRQARRAPLDRRPPRRAFELAEPHRLPDGRQPSARRSRTSARSSPGSRGPSTRSSRRSSTCSPMMQHKPYNSRGPGYLGSAHRPARMDGDDLGLMQADGCQRPTGSTGAAGCSPSSTASAASATSPQVDGMDSVYRRAFDVLTSSKVAEALDVDPRGPAAPRPLRQGLVEPPRRRRPDVERPAPDRPPAGRGRGPGA